MTKIYTLLSVFNSKVLKKLFVFIFLHFAILFPVQSIAQPADWQWGVGAVGSAFGAGTSVCTDSSGFIYVSGRFRTPTIVLGNVTLMNTDVTGNTYDIFIVKYDSYGSVVWAKSAGGIGDESAFICMDPSGMIYFHGNFSSANPIFGTFTLSNVGSNDIFIAKCDQSGDFIWAHSFGGTGDDWSVDLCADNSENIYLTGVFRSSSILFGSNTLTNPSVEEIYIVKIDSSGNVSWAKKAGGISGGNRVEDISCNSNGSVFVTGEFNGASISFGSTVLNRIGYEDIFIAKYNGSGNLQWATSFAGTQYVDCSSISAGDSGEVYITGGFNDASINFGSTTLVNSDVTGYYSDGFIARVDSAGSVVWAKSFGSATFGDGGSSISVGRWGNIFVTGYIGAGTPYYPQTINFGSVTVSNTHWIDATFLIQLDANGNVQGGSTLPVWGKVFTDKIGNVFMTGSFMYDPLAMGTNVLHWYGGWSYFMAKYDGVTGMQSYTQNNSVGIYPNPTNGKFIIKLENFSGKSQTELYNMLGEKIFADEFLNNEMEIDLSNQPKGIYSYRIFDENGEVSSGKVVVQ
ncbi:hypothetical protein BH09BAC5_BH09BAC5_05270 [soil metagenome]